MENSKLPNAIAILVLGILSIITCWCYGLFGMVLAIIGMYLTHNDLKTYNQSPEKYDNYSLLNTGKILCIIGIIMNAIMILYIIWFIKMIGLETFKDPVLLQEKLKHLQNLGR